MVVDVGKTIAGALPAGALLLSQATNKPASNVEAATNATAFFMIVISAMWDWSEVLRFG
ncbi:MAG: hypothetical protein HZB53_14675 [Chloroflexi bacterium]|nr:hypothetical protein [Chloroflexota bacterium]